MFKLLTAGNVSLTSAPWLTKYLTRSGQPAATAISMAGCGHRTSWGSAPSVSSCMIVNIIWGYLRVVFCKELKNRTTDTDTRVSTNLEPF